MKIMIGEYEVEIKARDARFRQRANKEDTINLLNEMSIAFGEAAKLFSSTHAEPLAKIASKKSDDIYNALDAIGVYDNCNE